MHNYYEILKIKPDASKEIIKKAFREEALKWHPDRNKSPEARERMQLINEAYLILKDDEARFKYDIEYQRYHNFKEQNSSYREEEYAFDDETLNDWIKKARVQAKEMVKMSIDDLVGMSKVAFSSAWEATKYHVLVLIVLSFILIAII